MQPQSYLPSSQSIEQAVSQGWSRQQVDFMVQALVEAVKAWQRREVPVGCVLVRNGEIVGRGHNLTNRLRNGTRHAEFQAIDHVLASFDDQAQGRQALSECELYVTVEPCIMCAGALAISRICKVHFGCGNDRFGGCGSILHVHESGCGACGNSHGNATTPTPTADGYPVSRGLFAEEAVKLLQSFYLSGNPAAPKPHRSVRHDLRPEGELPAGDASFQMATPFAACTSVPQAR